MITSTCHPGDFFKVCRLYTIPFSGNLNVHAMLSGIAPNIVTHLEFNAENH
jgi:hypothetical protein